VSENNKEPNAYILGTDPAELKRLGIQHQVWASEAQRGWKEAGFGKGMTILDLGSGPGFCTKELGYLVGDTGKVIAIDKSEGYIKYLQAINEYHRLNIETIAADFDNMALKPGGKMVIHEYYHWMTHQINPARPTLQKAIAMCYQSFQDAAGNIDIGKELPTILADAGMQISSTRSMSKFANPKEIVWQWPRTFYDVYWPKIKDMGYLTDAELVQARKELYEVESLPDTTLLCPLLVEVIAEKPS